MSETLIRIAAPHFVAGIVAVGGRVAMAAPILRYMTGWSGPKVASYCRTRGWTWERVE